MNDIILVGPKHCGKTSAGKALASLFSCSFIDLDELILQITGKTPRRLYDEGQAVFQKAEADALASIIAIAGVGNNDQDKRIIATGGGIIDNPEAAVLLSRLKNSGAVILHLNLPAASAWQRITAEGDLPPFLRTENPQENHSSLHERRCAAYQQIASFSIYVEGKSPEEIAASFREIMAGSYII